MTRPNATDYDGRGRQGPRQGQDGPQVSPLDPGRLGLPSRPVSDVDQVAEALEHLSGQGVNLLAPVTRLQFIPQDYQVAFRAVLFSMGGPWESRAGAKSNGTWYTTDGEGLALHKAALAQLAAAAGVSIETHRTDGGREPGRWEYTAIARLRTMDGSWRHVSASKEVDLRDGSPTVQAWKDQAARKRNNDGGAARISKAREHGGRTAEAKATNAAIRLALGIQGSYSEVQARRPFVFPLLVWTPTSAEGRQLRAAVELGVVGQLYGPSSRGPALVPAGQVIDATAADVQALPDHGPDTTPDFQRERVRPEPRERRPQEGPPPVDEPPAWLDQGPDFDPDW